MATHSSILAWRIPWTEEPGRQHSIGSQSRTQLSDYHSLQSQVKKQQLELDMEQWTGFKLRKEYIKAIYCHPAYLTYICRVHHVKSRAR